MSVPDKIDFCKKTFNLYSPNPALVNIIGDSHNAHNYHFFCAGFNHGIEYSSLRDEEIRREIKRLEAILVSK